MLNDQYEKAVDFLGKLHGKHPDHPDVQYTLLDALFATGKDEDDFDWVEKPAVVRFDNEVSNECHSYLKSKRKPRSVEDVYQIFLAKGYLLFTSEDLLKAMKTEQRFIFVTSADEPFNAEVRARRKSDS